jgi:hypothetical protein
MDVDGARHYYEAARRDLLVSRRRFAGYQNRLDYSRVDPDVAGGASATGKDGVSAFDH